MVAGFIALGVLAHHAGDVGGLPAGELAGGAEEPVEALAEGLVASVEAYQPFDVVLDVEGVLPGIGLGEVDVDLARVERLDEDTSDARTAEACLRVEDIAVELAADGLGADDAVRQVLVGEPVPQKLGRPGDAPVSYSIFKCL